MLREQPLLSVYGAMPIRVIDFVDTGLKRAKKIDCFDFVPSNPCVLYSVLSALPKCRICEWGSGIGIGVGLATMLGHQAVGIELNEQLFGQSKKLFEDFNLSATIHCGSYFEIDVIADYYFAYCWPSQILKVEELFRDKSPENSKLLICDGAERIRCMKKQPS